MRRIVAVLLACACAPTGEPAGEPVAEPDVVDEPPPVDVGTEDTRYLPRFWPGCNQTYGLGSSQHPFVWDRSPPGVEFDHRCRFGCTMTTAEPATEAPGIDMRLLDDGQITIRSSTLDARWERRLARDGFVPEIVRWTSWCGDELTVAAHDRRRVRVVSLSRTTGEVVDEFERTIAIGRRPDEAFDLQLHCWDLHTAVHALGTKDAWSIDMPRHGATSTLRVVPAEVFERIRVRPSHEQESVVREVHRTRTRIHHRVGDEVFALDRDGAPLWHRKATVAEIGCVDGTEQMFSAGCSFPTQGYEWLSTIGEYVFLDAHGGTDVFDADGNHVAFVSP
jgi:hypothetical protein